MKLLFRMLIVIHLTYFCSYGLSQWFEFETGTMSRALFLLAMAILLFKRIERVLLWAYLPDSKFLKETLEKRSHELFNQWKEESEKDDE